MHSKQIKALLTSYGKLIRYATEEELEQGMNPHVAWSGKLTIGPAFISPSAKDSLVSGGLRRAGTVVRGPDGKKEKGKKAGSGMKPSEVYHD